MIIPSTFVLEHIARNITMLPLSKKSKSCLHPSYKTIGSAVGLSKNTVKKHIDGLVAKQLITTEPTTVITKKGQKHNGTLLYTIRPIQEAVEYRYQQQLRRFEAEMYRQKTLARIEKLYGDQGSRKKQVKVCGLPTLPTSDGRADR